MKRKLTPPTSSPLFFVSIFETATLRKKKIVHSFALPLFLLEVLKKKMLNTTNIRINKRNLFMDIYMYKYWSVFFFLACGLVFLWYEDARVNLSVYLLEN